MNDLFFIGEEEVRLSKIEDKWIITKKDGQLLSEENDKNSAIQQAIIKINSQK